MNHTSIHQYGQYFTTNTTLKTKLLEFILNDPRIILEPSIGRGDLVLFVKDKLPSVLFDMYEIDDTIVLLDGIEKDDVVYGDFLTQVVSRKYMTIVGNPPFVRTKKGNLYIDFIEKCFQMLDDSGELIFIVPSDFFKLTSATRLLNSMTNQGTFTHIFHPHDEKMFENATIDVLVFRYCKDVSLITNKVLYNGELLNVINSNGLITFDNTDMKNRGVLFQEHFDIYVGLVSGKESVFKNEELGNISVLNGKDVTNRYIQIDTYPSDTEAVNEYLLQNKQELLNRGIRKFDERNWYQWGAPRNIHVMKTCFGQKCIYIYNLTRKPQIAFPETVQYFGGGLIMLKPKNNQCDIDKCLAYINSGTFQNKFRYSGRFKIGQRQLCNSYMPMDCLLDCADIL